MLRLLSYQEKIMFLRRSFTIWKSQIQRARGGWFVLGFLSPNQSHHASSVAKYWAPERGEHSSAPKLTYTDNSKLPDLQSEARLQDVPLVLMQDTQTPGCVWKSLSNSESSDRAVHHFTSMRILLITQPCLVYFQGLLLVLTMFYASNFRDSAQ